MEYDGPFRRFSLQEHGRYVGQRVGTNSNPDLLSAIPSEYEELSPNYHYVHKVGPLHAPRKLSLEEYRMMQQVPGVSQFQPVYSMPYPIQMASPARPVQEVQPYGVDRSPPGLSQSLQIQAMKRRHMLRSQQSQSQGYAPQQLQGTVYTEQPENFTSECPTSQPSQRQPSRQVQSCSNMYGFQQMEPTQSYGSVPSHLLSVSSPVESPMSMPTMSPVQMVRPIQQYQHMGSGSSLQFVPMQTLSGTHGAPFAYRGNSMEDDVFVAYQPMEMPYFDQDNSIYEFEQAQPQYVANHPSAQQSYVGIQRSPTSASESGDSTNVKRVTRTPRSHKDLRVSFVDELPEFQRERSFSSPPYMAPYMAPKEGNTDTEPYVGLKRADSRAVPRKTSPLADRTNETNKPEPEDPSNTYAGLRRLPRDKTTAVRSAKEKKEAAENEVDGQHQNTSAALSGVGEKTEDSDETGDVENRLPMNKPAVMRRAGEPRETAAVNKPYGDGERAQVRDARRTSVPARMRSYSEALVNTEKNRRNSFCPMTAYNLRGSSTVAIDNKIEQAMDLVKSHLMFAVREEVEVLKEQIAELIERNNQLEYENGILRAAASPETLAKLAAPRQQPPSSSS